MDWTVDCTMTVVLVSCAWLVLIAIACIGYAETNPLNAPNAPRHFLILPFIAVGDLLNTIARWRTGTLLARVQNAAGSDGGFD